MKARLPSISVSWDGRTDEVASSFALSQSSILSSEALRLRPQVAAAIRILSQWDSALQKLSEHAIDGIANSVRAEEKFRIRENEEVA